MSTCPPLVTGLAGPITADLNQGITWRSYFPIRSDWMDRVGAVSRLDWGWPGWGR